MYISPSASRRRSATATAVLILLILLNIEEIRELSSDALRGRSGRDLRFFDPNHRLCGEDHNEAQHWFAVHCLYGATTNAFPDYYDGDTKTITTDRDFDPKNREEVEHVLRVLLPVARKTKRAIRVRMELILVNWGNHFVDDVQEHVQPYSVVNAAELSRAGVSVVEPSYWMRCDGVRSVNKKPLHSERIVKLSSDSEKALSNLTSTALLNDEADELIFLIDELMGVDDMLTGELVGKDGGFVFGRWQKNFACAEPTEEIMGYKLLTTDESTTEIEEKE